MLAAAAPAGEFLHCYPTNHEWWEEGSAGCNEPSCCSAVCDVDDTCCWLVWDTDCVNIASALCQQQLAAIAIPPGAALEEEKCGIDINRGCNPPPTLEPCCSPLAWECDDPTCSAALCAIRPECCDQGWDLVCAVLASELCPQLCPPITPRFSSLTIGTPSVGTIWATTDASALDHTVDEDWYELSLSAESEVTIDVTSEWPITVGVVRTNGVPDCSLAEYLDPMVGVPALGAASASGSLAASTRLTACLGPGTHWIVVKPLFAPAACPARMPTYLLDAHEAPAACPPFLPINDEPEGAIAIDEGETSLDTTYASDSAVGPTSCGPLSRDLWYRFVAPRHGAVRIECCGTTSFTAQMAVYDAAGEREVDCDIDGAGCPYADPVLAWEVAAGESYLLRIGGRPPEWSFPTTFGPMSFRLQYVPCEAAYDVQLITGLPPGSSSVVTTLSPDASVVAGRTGGLQGFRWTAAKGLELFAMPSGMQNLTISSVNNHGVVVGAMTTSASIHGKAIRITGTDVEVLPPAPGFLGAAASAIDADGVIVGTCISPAPLQATLWTDGVAAPVPGLGANSQGIDRNDEGMTIGTLRSGASPFFAVQTWRSEGDLLTWIPEAPSNRRLEARSVNAAGHITGTTWTLGPDSGYQLRAFVWTPTDYRDIEPIFNADSSRGLMLAGDDTLLGAVEVDQSSFIKYALEGFLARGESVYSLQWLLGLSPAGRVRDAGAMSETGVIGGAWQLPGVNTSHAITLHPREPSGDLTCDGVVGIEDLSIVLSAWGSAPGPMPHAADLTLDGTVDSDDLSIVLSRWNASW